MVDYKLIFEFLFELLKVASVFLATVAGIITKGKKFVRVYRAK